MNTYKIIRWDNREVIDAGKMRLRYAKAFCRRLGHNGQSNGRYYASMCYVADADGVLVYTPRFEVGKDDNKQTCLKAAENV